MHWKICKKSGEIQVIYPKQRLGHLVSAPSTATSETADKDTQFLSIFDNFAQQFSHENLENVSDLP